MKKILLLFIVLFIQLLVWGQDSCIQKQYSIIRKIIQKSIPYTDAGGDYAVEDKVAEFFILEINLNEKEDSVVAIDYYCKEGAKNKKQIEKAIKKIKETWKPYNCRVNRIIIPVFIYFQDKDKLENYPFALKTNTLIPNEPEQITYTYMGSEIIIFVFGTVH